MRKQQQIWHDEHTNQGTLPTMANIEPASGVVQFIDWLKLQNVALAGKAVDIDWQIDDNFFDLAIDSFSSIDIETKLGRERCRDEMYRTLKPGGYALVTVCSAEDEWEKELIASHPGPEPNSTIWPQNGKFQKDYDETELREFYKTFDIVELKRISKPAFKLGRDGTATNLWVVLRK